MDDYRIGTYVNGNTIVAMYKDGTKIRYAKIGEEPYAEFPESMDRSEERRVGTEC